MADPCRRFRQESEIGKYRPSVSDSKIIVEPFVRLWPRLSSVITLPRPHCRLNEVRACAGPAHPKSMDQASLFESILYTVSTGQDLIWTFMALRQRLCGSRHKLSYVGINMHSFALQVSLKSFTEIICMGKIQLGQLDDSQVPVVVSK